MTSLTTPRFWAAYRELPTEVREAARKAYALFRENPQHPSLQFKKVHEREPRYSVRVTIGTVPSDPSRTSQITWFWIGSHADYDRLLKSL